MSTCMAIGAQGRIITKNGAGQLSWTGSERAQDVLTESLGKQGSILDTSGIRGTREHTSARTRTGTYAVGGSLAIAPSPLDMDDWLPRVMGGAKGAGATNRIDLTEVLFPFSVLIDRVTKVFEYQDCYISRMVLGGTAGSPISLQVEMVGKLEDSTVAWPSGVSYTQTPQDQPFVFTDVTLILQGQARPIENFAMTIDNGILAQWRNSITATCIEAQDLAVTLSCQNPFTTSEYNDLYDQVLAGAPGSLIIQQADAGNAYSCQFDFGTLQVPSQSPTIPGKTEIPLNLNMVARKVVGLPTVQAFSDST